MTAESELQHICVVCAEATTAASSAECNWCEGRYHLNQRNDSDTKECGRVWIDEQFLALQFACDTCLGGAEKRESTRGRRGRQPGAPATRRRYKRIL